MIKKYILLLIIPDEVAIKADLCDSMVFRTACS